MARSQPRLTLVSNTLEFGGTERGMATVAKALVEHDCQVSVVAALRSGPMAAELDSAGVQVRVTDGNPDRLEKALKGARTALVFRSGGHEPLVPAAARAAGVEFLVEWSMFGAVDKSADEQFFAGHLFNSKMCWVRYRNRVGGAEDFWDRHRVLYLPIDIDDLRGLARPQAEARSALGLDPVRPTVARVGRSDDIKWRNMLVEMIPRLRASIPNVQVILLGTTPKKKKLAKELGVEDCCLFVDESPDRRVVATVLSASDVTINGSTIGESQGLAIAESMAIGIPVVTSATPWIDNAQVELVANGERGFVVAHPNQMADAVAFLLEHGEVRRRMGEAAKEFAEQAFSPRATANQLISMYHSLDKSGKLPSVWSPSSASCDEFADNYELRSRELFRASSKREQLESLLTRVAEQSSRRVQMLSQKLTNGFNKK